MFIPLLNNTAKFTPQNHNVNSTSFWIYPLHWRYLLTVESCNLRQPLNPITEDSKWINLRDLASLYFLSKLTNQTKLQLGTCVSKASIVKTLRSPGHIRTDRTASFSKQPFTARACKPACTPHSLLYHGLPLALPVSDRKAVYLRLCLRPPLTHVIFYVEHERVLPKISIDDFSWCLEPHSRI